MAEASSNVGSASHLGEGQSVRDSHFIYDYSRRRVPLPVVSYLAVADASGDLPAGENPAKRALDMLRDLVEPAVIAEEELNTEHMERLFRDALEKINAELATQPQAQPPGAVCLVSLTAVVADTGRAFIGHTGNTRVYLLHNERLYDLVPSGAVKSPEPPPPSQEVAPTLFQAAEASPEQAALPLQEAELPAEAVPLPGQPPVVTPGVAPEPPADQAGVPGAFPGQAAGAVIGFNQVDIVPGDTLVLCTDGLWKAVSEEEMVENLLSAMSVQRSSNQLIRLAYSRDASDNATMVAWQYGPGEEGATPVTARAKAISRTKTRASESLLVALLVLVLVGIFAVGFAFGWRITDTFRKPAKQAEQKSRKANAVQEEKKEEQKQDAQQSAPAAQSVPQPAFPHPAAVSGQGVRMRASPDTNAELIGLLRDGQQVTVLGEVMGADSKTWSRVKGVARSEGQDKDAEGYVRNDFLKASQQAGTPATSAP